MFNQLFVYFNFKSNLQKPKLLLIWVQFYFNNKNVTVTLLELSLKVMFLILYKGHKQTLNISLIFYVILYNTKSAVTLLIVIILILNKSTQSE